VKLNGSSFTLDYLNNITMSASTMTLTSGNFTEIGSTLGSVTVNAAQGVNVSSGISIPPLLGTVGIASTALIRMDSPMVMLTGNPVSTTSNSTPVLAALNGLTAAVVALAAATYNPAAAGAAIASGIAATTVNLPLIPNPRVLQ